MLSERIRDLPNASGASGPGHKPQWPLRAPEDWSGVVPDLVAPLWVVAAVTGFAERPVGDGTMPLTVVVTDVTAPVSRLTAGAEVEREAATAPRRRRGLDARGPGGCDLFQTGAALVTEPPLLLMSGLGDPIFWVDGVAPGVAGPEGGPSGVGASGVGASGVAGPPGVPDVDSVAGDVPEAGDGGPGGMTGGLSAGVDVSGVATGSADPFTGWAAMAAAAGPSAGETLPLVYGGDDGVPATGACCGGACDVSPLPVPSDGAVWPW